MQVPAGIYSLWTVPHTNGVDLILNKQAGQWGTEYKGSLNQGMAKMTSEVRATSFEQVL